MRNVSKKFYGGRYNVEVLKEAKILYRVGDTKNPLGQWLTENPTQSVAKVRMVATVKPYWLNNDGGWTNSISHIDTIYKIEIPVGTTIYL